MIKAQTIITQLQDVLPAQTSLFTEADISITTLTRSGTTVTAVTASVHGLVTGNFVFVDGAKSPISITSITRVGTIATVVTATNHDFTEGFDQTAEITGADQTDYNGTFTIITVANRRTFTYTVSGSPVTPATGTIFVLNNLSTGYNGRHSVTVTNTTTFTYEITQTPLSPAQGSPVIKKGLRISGAVSMVKAVDAYTSHNLNELWGFVVLGDVFASKDRSISTDATTTFAGGDEFRQRVICPFDIFVITPTTSSIAGRQARDQMEDVAVAFFKSLLRSKLATVLTCSGTYDITFVGHRFVAFADAYYVHQFQFETVTDITYDDTIPDDFNIAFRDVSLDFQNPNETDDDNTIMTADVDLDDTPL